jgi:hypothetical protein
MLLHTVHSNRHVLIALTKYDKRYIGMKSIFIYDAYLDNKLITD